MPNQNIENQLLALQHFISSESAFLAKGQRPFSLLGMSIKGMGKVPFPITPGVAKELISFATQAPYGKGHQTLVDTTVRNTWEIEPTHVEFSNNNLASDLKKIIKSIQEQLGLEHLKIEASFYKLLIYEKDSFFLKHKDSEKEKGMFGTLVLTLPSDYEGGEFVIEFDGKKEIVTHENKDESINWLAFYADCDHEILPITNGYRLALVYNLISKENKPKPFVNSAGLAKAIEVLQQNDFANLNQPIALYLQHQYTETNFSVELLKGSDLTCASILLEAAKKVGWYGNIALLEHRITGIPENEYYERDFDPEMATMDEIFDENDDIIDWCLEPGLGNINLDDFIIINKINYNVEEPIEKDGEGFMGNYGPELYFTYRNSIIILVPPQALNSMLYNIGFKEKLQWINYYINKDPADLGQAEKIYQVINWDNNRNKDLIFDGLLKLWLKNINLFLTDGLAYDKFAKALTGAETFLVATFLINLPEDKVMDLLLECIRHSDDDVVGKTYEVISKLFSVDPKFSEKNNLHQLAIGNYKTQKELNTKSERTVILSLLDIFAICKFNINAFKSGNQSKINRNWIYQIAIPIVKSYTTHHNLFLELKNFAIEYLIHCTLQEPEYPTNFIRNFPILRSLDIDDIILKSFCEDAGLKTLHYSKAENKRKALQYKINNYALDIDTRVIKKGSPYTLVLTKNTATYYKHLNDFKEDKLMLKKLRAI